MAEILNVVLHTALVIHIAMISVCVWRLWRGENIIDRLIGADLVGTLILAVLVLVALIQGNSIYIDVAIGLAALGYIGTITLARYITEEHMF